MPTFKIFDVDALPSTQDLLSESLVNIVAATPTLTDIAIGSKLWSICYASARQKASIYYTLHFYKKQSYVITATGKYLDLHGLEVGVFRQKAISARGIATFSRTSASPYKILIPSGTVIATPRLSSDIEPSKFVTVDDVYIDVGGTSVNVNIVAAIAGVDGNLPAGAISSIESQIAGVQYVVTTSTSGGQEIESDAAFRERILTAWAGRMTGTAAAIRDAVLSVQGIRNVMIVDPARNRVKQHYTIKSTDDKRMILLETKTPLEAGKDIYVELAYKETGLTLSLKQQDENGNQIYSEEATKLTDGVSLLTSVNYWSQSATLQILSLILDDNPYDDPSPIATDNEVVYVRTISEEVSNHLVTLIISDAPSGNNKRLVISTYREFRHNEILGQTEVTPLVEVIEGFETYDGMCNMVNAQSKIIQMTLLDVKTANEELMPTWNQAYNTNTVQTTFKPILEIVSPTDSDIVILNQTDGVIDVGSGAAASPIGFVYKYQTDFGTRLVEDRILNLERDGSSLVYASPIATYSDASEEPVYYLDTTPSVFPSVLMTPEFELVRGRVDVIPIPYALPISDEVLKNVVAEVEKVKAAGVEVFVKTPSVQFLDVTAKIEVETTDSSIYPSQFYDLIRTNITDYINQLDMGETVYVEKIIAAANPDVKGLKVAHVVTPTDDVTPAALTFLRAGTIDFV